MCVCGVSENGLAWLNSPCVMHRNGFGTLTQVYLQNNWRECRASIKSPQSFFNNPIKCFEKVQNILSQELILSLMGCLENCHFISKPYGIMHVNFFLRAPPSTPIMDLISIQCILYGQILDVVYCHKRKTFQKWNQKRIPIIPDLKIDLLIPLTLTWFHKKVLHCRQRWIWHCS